MIVLTRCGVGILPHARKAAQTMARSVVEYGTFRERIDFNPLISNHRQFCVPLGTVVKVELAGVQLLIQFCGEDMYECRW